MSEHSNNSRREVHDSLGLYTILDARILESAAGRDSVQALPLQSFRTSNVASLNPNGISILHKKLAINLLTS